MSLRTVPGSTYVVVPRARALWVCCYLQATFHAHGYLLGLYGSCLGPEGGRDVDLLAVPWRIPERTGLDRALATLRARKGQEEVGVVADAAIYEFEGLLLDVRFTRWCEAIPQ